MRRFVEEADRGQWTLLPECLDDFIDESNPVRVVDAFVDALDLAEMSFEGVDPAATGRPSYHPSVLLKLYIYGYLNRVQSSRRLEREAGRNVEVMWLLGRLAPDHKTIADFRKDNGLALRRVCARFVELCREMGLLATASVAIDGSKFKAVNNRDRNFTSAKVQRRRAQLEESVARYLSQLDTADRQEPTEALAARVTKLKEKLTKLKEEMGKLVVYEKQMLTSPDQQISLTDPDSRSMATSGRGSGVVGYNVQVAVDTEHHLIVTHEVTNSGSDRAQLANMAKHESSARDRDARGRGRSRLLQRPGDPRLPRGRHHRNIAQTADVERQGGRALWQAGLCLFAGGRRLSLPGRRATVISLHEQGGRQTDKTLLDDGLPELFDQIPMHDGA
jgi:transposase